MNAHFKGVYFLTQKLLPLMKDGGRIVNISSGLARFSIPGTSAYGAAKGALEVLTRYIYGIRSVDPLTLAAVALGMLLATMVAAAAIPASRITRLNPADTLRSE